MLAASLTNAMPLAAYRERVHQSAVALDALEARDEEMSDAEHGARIASTIKGVRAAVLVNETVELNGEAVHVDNAWLDESLHDYEKMPATDRAARADALRRITERLYALSERLSETEAQKLAEQKSKDEEKALLASILKGQEKEKVDETSAWARFWNEVSRLWQRFLRWLSSLFPESKPLKPGEARAASGVAQIFIISLALGLILFVGWKLAPRFAQQRRGRKREKREARIVLGERLEADQTSADLLAEAEALARAGNLRAAIRKGYIALLCELGDRKILSLAQSKTNRDYLRALQNQETIYPEMRHLTDSFENHWYGLAPATENDWNTFRSGINGVLITKY
ncbi:MAG: DUF4129 domain-containing protein [Pyrinomonadaceae bacterium]